MLSFFHFRHCLTTFSLVSCADGGGFGVKVLDSGRRKSEAGAIFAFWSCIWSSTRIPWANLVSSSRLVD